MIGNPTRPGDLAVTIDCDINSGRFVRVLETLGHDRFIETASPMWSYSGSFRPGKGWILDKYLQPIRPPSPEEQGERAEHSVGVV